MNTFMLMGTISKILKISENDTRITLRVYEEKYGYSNFGESDNYDDIPMIIINRRLYGRKFRKGDNVVVIGRIHVKDDNVWLSAMKIDYLDIKRYDDEEII